jgi:glycosyltransferase involved in cell wall biosynthesis
MCRPVIVVALNVHSFSPIGILAPLELVEFRDFLFPKYRSKISARISGATPIHLLCKELLKRGHYLVLFSVHPSVQDEQVLEGERLRIYLGPIKTTSVLNCYKEERRFLTAAMRREKLACVHAHWTYEYALAAIEAGFPHLITAHDSPLTYLKWDFVLNPFESQNEKSYYRTIKTDVFRIARTFVAFKAARAARRLTAVSPHVAEHLRRHHFHNKPIEVIPNGMPNEYFERQRQRALDQTFTFVTALHHWGRLKNAAAAIEAFAKVKKALPAVKMLMFGTAYGPEGPAAAWAHKRGWHEGIEFRGHVPHTEMIEVLSRRVDALVHPSNVEAHPMPLIEAMSLGIPVIGGRAAGGVPWTLGDGAYGLLVDVRSTDEIASAMLRLAQDEQLRTRLEVAGRESVRRRFHIADVTDRYEAVYAQVARQKV